MALFDSGHTATSSATGPAIGHVEWTRNLGGNITPGPVVGADGTIYVATNAGVLHALDSSTGADQWTFTGQGASTGPADLSTSPLVLPAVDVLWPGPGNSLYLLSSSGQLLWHHTFGAALTSPVQSGSSVYVGTTGGDLVALDVGGPVPQVRWQLSIGRSSYGSPVVAPDGEVVSTADNRLVAVRDRGTRGIVAWHRTFRGAVEAFRRRVSRQAPWSWEPTTHTSTPSFLGWAQVASPSQRAVVLLTVGQSGREHLLRREHRTPPGRQDIVRAGGDHGQWDAGPLGSSGCRRPRRRLLRHTGRARLRVLPVGSPPLRPPGERAHRQLSGHDGRGRAHRRRRERHPHAIGH